MSLRVFVEGPLEAGAALELPAAATRHVQVRRLQPGDALVLFNGQGGEWRAEVVVMGRSRVEVRVLAHHPVSREPARAVTLAVGMPANERMDWLVEKAAELGAAAIVPLLTERAVLRLEGERAQKRRAHWQAVAVAAAEQSGATRVTQVAEVQPLSVWLATAPRGAHAWMLSLDPAPARSAPPAGEVFLLSGPEGGLSPAEQAAAAAAGFGSWNLGPRILRAETAPLVALSQLVGAESPAP
jgi:16S rRNA (uracil1498-N3)-methyltransferase